MASGYGSLFDIIEEDYKQSLREDPWFTAAASIPEKVDYSSMDWWEAALAGLGLGATKGYLTGRALEGAQSQRDDQKTALLNYLDAEDKNLALRDPAFSPRMSQALALQTALAESEDQRAVDQAVALEKAKMGIPMGEQLATSLQQLGVPVQAGDPRANLDKILEGMRIRNQMQQLQQTRATQNPAASAALREYLKGQGVTIGDQTLPKWEAEIMARGAQAQKTAASKAAYTDFLEKTFGLKKEKHGVTVSEKSALLPEGKVYAKGPTMNATLMTNIDKQNQEYSSMRSSLSMIKDRLRTTDPGTILGTDAEIMSAYQWLSTGAVRDKEGLGAQLNGLVEKKILTSAQVGQLLNDPIKFFSRKVRGVDQGKVLDSIINYYDRQHSDTLAGMGVVDAKDFPEYIKTNPHLIQNWNQSQLGQEMYGRLMGTLGSETAPGPAPAPTPAKSQRKKATLTTGEKVSVTKAEWENYKKQGLIP